MSLGVGGMVRAGMANAGQLAGLSGEDEQGMGLFDVRMMSEEPGAGRDDYNGY